MYGIMLYTITAQRTRHAPMHSGTDVLARCTAETLGEANAIAIELADTDGAEEVVISRPSWADYCGEIPAYYRVLDLCPIVWDGTESWR